MKRQLAIALGLAVVSTSALASKARLEALGQGANGSQVVDDHRSIFLNAAHLNHHKDFATFEFGDTTQNEDGRTTPRAEGGVFQSSGNMVYGLYFGEELDGATTARTNINAALGSSLPEEMNNTTIFFAGDAGVQWGASVLFGSHSDEQSGNKEVSASQTRARFGVISGNIDAFLNMGLSNVAEDKNVTNAKVEGKSSMDIGVTYNQGDANYMLRRVSSELEVGTSDVSSTYMALGASKEYKLNDKARMWASVFYVTDESETDTGSALTSTESKDTTMPVTMALEVSANDWLKLRGSISQNVFISENDNGTDTSTIADSTSTAFGASFVYGDLSVDAMVGGSASAADDTSTSGQFGSDEMLHRLSMTYNF